MAISSSGLEIDKMRFSDNGYYLEEYVKCRNCGVLIYSGGIKIEIDKRPAIFCSDWCISWHLDHPLPALPGIQQVRHASSKSKQKKS
jgi:hypothetical protein